MARSVVRHSSGGWRWAAQADGFFFVCSDLKSHFGASGIVVAEVKYSIERCSLPLWRRIASFVAYCKGASIP
jgi:hypothetical protein